MHTDHMAAIPQLENPPEWRIETSNIRIELPENRPIDYDKILRKCGNSAAACTCGVAVGVVGGHVGCVVSAGLALLGATGGIGLSTFNLTFSAASTAAGLAPWYLLRWKKAGKVEKSLTLGGAAIGAAMSLTLHFSGAVGKYAEIDRALNWYQKHNVEEQHDFTILADATRSSLVEYLLKHCIPFRAQPEPSAPPTRSP